MKNKKLQEGLLKRLKLEGADFSYLESAADS
jgi:hypothetical protein